MASRGNRILILLLVVLLSGAGLLANVRKLNSSPPGEDQFLTFRAPETKYRVMQNDQCVAEISLRNDPRKSLFINGKVQTRDWGMIDLQFGLAFNELFQFSKGLGYISVAGSKIAVVNLSGATPVSLNVTAPDGRTLFTAPPLPILVLLERREDDVTLKIRGLGSSRTPSVSRFAALREQISVRDSSPSEPPCSFAPLSIAGLLK